MNQQPTPGLATSATLINSSDSSRFGGFWIRVGAYFVDTVVMMIPVLLISFLFRSTQMPVDDLELAIVELVDSTMTLLAWWIYFAVLHSSKWQASVGKMVVGLKVVDENGNRISFARATGRYFAAILSVFTLCIGYMMAGWTKQKRSLHDMIAGTYVVRANEV